MNELERCYEVMRKQAAEIEELTDALSRVCRATGTSTEAHHIAKEALQTKDSEQ